MLITLFFQAVQATYRVEEITNSCYQQLDDERKKRVTAVQSFNIADQSNKDLRKKLTKEEKAKKSADSALESTQRQAEEQRQLQRDAKKQLAFPKEQIAALRKKLEEAQKLQDQTERLKNEAEKAKIEAEKAKNEAEQQGYDLRVAETEETLWAELPAMCRIYYAQTWDKALNRARVKAFSKLIKPENIYYLSAIRASDLPSTQGEVASTVSKPIKETQPQNPLPPNQQEQTKKPEAPKEISLNKAAEVPEDGAASQCFEQALASVTMPAREALKEKEEIVPIEADKTAGKTSKDTIQIKLKQ